MAMKAEVKIEGIILKVIATWEGTVGIRNATDLWERRSLVGNVAWGVQEYGYALADAWE